MLYFLPQVMARLTRKKMGHLMLIKIQIHLSECKTLDICLTQLHFQNLKYDKEVIASQKCKENTKINENFYPPEKFSLRFLCQYLFLEDRTKTFQLHYQLQIINTTTKWYLKATKHRIFWVRKTKQPLSWSPTRWKLGNSKLSTFKTKIDMALKKKRLV